MTRITSLAVLLTLAAGCVPAAPFRQGKPVEVEKDSIVHVYKQDGVQLKPASLLDGLVLADVSKKEATVAQAWTSGAQAVGAGAGLCLGFGAVAAVDGKSSGWPLIAGGVALTGVAVWFNAIGDGHLFSAVEAYNASLAPPPKVSWLPYLAPVAAATPQGKASGVEAGVVLRF